MTSGLLADGRCRHLPAYQESATPARSPVPGHALTGRRVRRPTPDQHPEPGLTSKLFLSRPHSNTSQQGFCDDYLNQGFSQWDHVWA